jgi:type IV pilus assembly protein PilB
MKRPRLGSILVQSGVIDELQLQSAMAYQRQWGMPLGRALVEKRLCTPEQVMEALSKQTGHPVIDLDKETLGPRQAHLLTLKVAEQYRVVPLRVEGSRDEVLVIAMAAPAPLASVDAVQSVSGKRRVTVYLAADEAIRRAIGRIYRGWTQAPAAAPAEAMPAATGSNKPARAAASSGPVLLYGWTQQAQSTISALLLSQGILAESVSAKAALSCRSSDVLIAPFSAFEALLAEGKTIPGRVLAVSKTPSSDIPKAQKAGAWGLLTPPFDSNRLVSAVQRCRSAKTFIWAT